MFSSTARPAGLFPLSPARRVPAPDAMADALPARVAAAIWRGDQMGSALSAVLPSGFAALDAELPGGGWPCHAVTDILMPQSGTLEWRLLAPLLHAVCTAGRSVVAVGPPKPPHLPGLRWLGLCERQLVWVQADTPAERLWASEQLVRANSCGVLVAWLPQVRQEQIRRLQVLAAAHEGPVFLCRPSAAAQESSAAPLRVLARVGPDWTLQLDIVKRKGPPLQASLSLPSVPGGLQTIMTPRLRFPSRLVPQEMPQTLSREVDHAVVRTPASQPRQPRRPGTVHH
jgi:protein ImuA